MYAPNTSSDVRRTSRRFRHAPAAGDRDAHAAVRSGRRPDRGPRARVIRIFTRFVSSVQTPHAVSAVGQTPSHRSCECAWTGVTAVTGTAPGRGRRPRSPGHIPRYDRDVHSSPLLHLSLSTSRHSSALTYMVQAHNHHTTRTHGALSRHSTRTAHSTRTDITHMHTAQRRERGWEVSRRGAEGSRGRGPGLRPPLRRQVPAPPLDAPWHLDAPRRPDTRHLVS